MLFPVLFALSLQAADPGASLVTINVAADRTTVQAHTITIAPSTGARPGSVEHRDHQTWGATRTSESGQETVTSDECPAIRSVVSSFGELPALQVNPPALAVTGADPIPVPPTIKDGFETTLSFRTFTEDGSFADVEIRHGNAYQRWGHEAVTALLGCWGRSTH